MFRTRVVLVLVVLLAGVRARADEDAKTLFMRGRTAYALGRFSEAAELFEKAFELKQDPAILYNAAQAHRLAGDKKKALVLYQNYLRLFGEQENASEVERRITELKATIDADEKANPTPPQAEKDEPSPAAPPAVVRPPAAAPIVATASAPPEHKPVTRRGWFWGVVVGSVIVVGGAVALGIVLGSPHKNPVATLGAVQAN